MAIGNPISLTSNVATKTISVIATASQTLFTVAGGYRINELAVFRNGVRLVNGRDFTARDGSIVTLLSAASEGDALEFQVFDTFRVADAITPFDSAQTIAGDLSIVGVLSATTLGSVNFNLTSGIQTFHDVRVGGALTVAGSLTYEDTTNTNTVGLATFSGGMNISGVGATVTTLNVTGLSTFSGGMNISGVGATVTTLNVTGVSTFAGAINGNLTGNATGLTGTPNIGVTDITCNSIVNNAGGGATWSLFNTGNATFKGDLTIADKIIHDGDTNTAIRFPAVDTFTVETAGSERLRVDSSGNFGIGTNNPGFDLEVVDSSGDCVIALQSPNSSNTEILFGDPDSSYSGRIRYGHSTNHLQFNTNASERLRITSAGNVGINSTIPGNTLSIDGDIGVYGSGTNHRNLYIYKDNVATAWFKYRGDTNVVIIGTNAGDKLTINPSGDLNVAGITTATQLFEGTTRVASTGKAIAMAMLFG